MTSRTLRWTASVVLSGYLWLAPAVQAQPPARALIVDTDAGDDDLMALAFLLARPDVRIEAITIAYGLAHQKPGAQNVLRLLDFAGRADVPVYLGRDTPRGAHNPFPEAWRTRSDAMAGLALPPSKRSPDAPEDGRTVREQQGTRIGVALGADQKRFLDLFLSTLARR